MTEKFEEKKEAAAKEDCAETMMTVMRKLDTKEVLLLADSILSATDMPDERASCPIRVRAEKMLLAAVIAYIISYTTEDCWTTDGIRRLAEAELREENEEKNTPLRFVIDEIRQYEEDSETVRFYDVFRSFPASTQRSAAACLGERLATVQYMPASGLSGFFVTKPESEISTAPDKEV